MTVPLPDCSALVLQSAHKPYRIREARTLRDLDEVHRITHDSIVQAGYMAPQAGGRVVSYGSLDPSPLTTILVAEDGGRIVGTNSLAADGPLGLHTDLHFPRETAEVRKEGSRLISSFRIAVDPAWNCPSGKHLVLDLIKWSAFVAIRKYRFETMLCTFNPKHEALYRRLLRAETLARTDSLGPGTLEAGAVLMRIQRAALETCLAEDLARFAAMYGIDGAPPTFRADDATEAQGEPAMA